MASRIRKAISSSILLACAVSLLMAAEPVPRHSPELKFLDPAGREVLLSSFKGKVVVVEFLFIRSQHCMRVAQTINQLNGELGRRGLQPVGIIFGSDANGPAVDRVVQAFKLTYPVGYASPAQVDAFLGRQRQETLKIPQIVVIDRAGVIRAQNGMDYDPNLENENTLRTLLNGLLMQDGSAVKASSGH